MARMVTLHITESELDTIGDALEAYAAGLQRAATVLYDVQTVRQRSRVESLRTEGIKLRHRLYQQAGQEQP